MPEAIFFDHDGTLVDSEGEHCRHWQRVLTEHGIELSADGYKETMAGIPTPTNAENLVRLHGLNVGAETLIRRKGEETRNFLSTNAFPLMPGVREAIDAVRQAGIRIGVVTGAGPHGVASTLRAYGLARFVDVTVSGEDVVRSKPAPDCYLLAMKRLGIEAKGSIAIEDTSHGVSSARAAGIACAAVPNTFSDNQDFTHADGIFGDITSAVAWALG